MKKRGLSVVLALALGATAMTFSAPASATKIQKFTSTISTLNTPVKINVVLNEDMLHRATHISRNMRDRATGIHSLHNGWTGQGEYGQRDLDRLMERLKRRMEAQLTKNGVSVDDESANVLNIVITDARPSRPTFTQLSHSSLSYSSFGLGGASFEGTLVQNGQEQGIVSYGWYENDITDARYGATWSDANRAIDRFARKTAKALK